MESANGYRKSAGCGGISALQFNNLISSIQDAFWGAGEPYKDDSRIEVFKVDFPDEQSVQNVRKKYSPKSEFFSGLTTSNHY